MKALHFLYDRFLDEYLENSNYDIFVIDADNIVQGCIDVQDLPALKIM